MRATIDNPHTVLPRILCLHGSGSNAQIFKAQTSALRYELSNYFRFVSVEGPFDSEPGPDATSAYEKFGPFRRCCCVYPGLIFAAMDRDDLQGGTGEYVALMGFSQGAKLAASLLFRQQVRAEKLGQAMSGPNFRFAVFLNGRGPLVSMDPELVMNSALLDASQISLDRSTASEDIRRKDHVLSLPTIHVHGLQDPELMLHHVFLQEYCSKNARLVE
ncbi:hypothetical protein BDV09DRAFT_190382 [Aspergillus tetrazonus]